MSTAEIVQLLGVAIALIIGSIINFYSLYQSIYWVVVEIFHIIGIILITRGIIGFNNKEIKNRDKRDKRADMAYEELKKDEHEEDDEDEDDNR